MSLVLVSPPLGLTGSAGGQQAEPDEDLYNLILAAQVRNLEAPEYRDGRLDFTLEYQGPSSPLRPNPRPVRMRGKTIWKGEKSLKVFQAEDPDKSVFGSPLEAELATAPTEYALFDGSSTFSYNQRTNTLHISSSPGSFHAWSLIDVDPHSLWFRCRFPNSGSGRGWIEMFKRSGPVIGPEDRISIDREGDHILHTRTMTDGGTSTITFSLQWDGNVVHSRYSGANRDERDIELSYEWGRDEDGLCILKRYEFKEFEPRSDTKLHQSLSITLDSVDLRRPVSAGDVSPRSLIAMLPRDVFVNDRIAGKRYFPNPGVKPPRIEFDRLAEIVAGEGFLVKD